jgi:hypothetical protein
MKKSKKYKITTLDQYYKKQPNTKSCIICGTIFTIKKTQHYYCNYCRKKEPQQSPKKRSISTIELPLIPYPPKAEYKNTKNDDS